MFYRPHSHVLSPKWVILIQKKVFFVTFGRCGVLKTLKFSTNVFGVPFRLIGIQFDHFKNKFQIFNFLPFPWAV